MRYSPSTLIVAAACTYLAACSQGPVNSTLSSMRGGDNSALSPLYPRLPYNHTLTAPHDIASAGVRRVRPENKLFKGTVWYSNPSVNLVTACTNSACHDYGSGWSSPGGMAIDHKHNIYVSDNGNSRIVVLNEAGSQIAVLSDPGETPEDVAVAPNGTVGVTNRYNVVFYAKGSSVITSTACCLLSEYQYGAFDKSGNFYADGFDASLHVTVEEVVNAAGGGTNETDTGYGNTIGFPGGIAIDKMDTLDVVDEHCLCVYQFPSGNKITLDNVVTPTAIALQKDDAEIAVADYSANGSVIFYAYPAGGAPIFYANNADYPDGVVINPGWQY